MFDTYEIPLTKFLKIDRAGIEPASEEYTFSRWPALALPIELPIVCGRIVTTSNTARTALAYPPPLPTPVGTGHSTDYKSLVSKSTAAAAV